MAGGALEKHPEVGDQPCHRPAQGQCLVMLNMAEF